MNIKLVEPIIIAAVVGLFIGAGSSYYATAKYKDSQWDKIIADQKTSAAALLQIETEKVLAAERKNTELNNQLDKVYGNSIKKISSVLSDNRRLAHEFGGLRDPGHRENCGSPETGVVAAGNSPKSAAEGRLSIEASEFLLELAADADRAAEYAETCFTWAQGAAGLGK